MCSFLLFGVFGGVMSPFMWVAFAGFLGVLSVWPLPGSRTSCLCFLLTPSLSLHAGGLCRVPEHLVLLLFAFVCLWVALPGSWASCLLLSPLSPFMRVAFVGFLSVLSPFVSLCLPLSPFVSVTWVAFAGFLGSLFPFVSLCLP